MERVSSQQRGKVGKTESNEETTGNREKTERVGLAAAFAIVDVFFSYYSFFFLFYYYFIAVVPLCPLCRNSLLSFSM
ncbi:hypothetical protein B9Z55_024366 [Caenorhabditis nigoni]|uniref:Transmembrane protein n=1 Tax=Caenorhabditis nigoni TaxID=1611254 RepID=A0A2G5SUJ1_9PELO|nr:hypothetical protein B9Z55_024366 [Caenorhabditis nigoni]